MQCDTNYGNQAIPLLPLLAMSPSAVSNANKWPHFETVDALNRGELALLSKEKLARMTPEQRREMHYVLEEIRVNCEDAKKQFSQLQLVSPACVLSDKFKISMA